MLCANKDLDTSNELVILPYFNGIRLVKPDHCANSFQNVASIMNLPCNVYFLDRQSKIQAFNEHTARIMHLDSIKKILGKTCSELIDRNAAEIILANDREVIKNCVPKILEETAPIYDNQSFAGLSIKLPWYNHKNKIIGIFGYTFALNAQSLPGSILRLAQSGMFNYLSNPIKFLPGKNIFNVYLSKRETEIVHYVMRGKSARIIGDILGISRRTVEQHVENMKNKLGVSTKMELIEKLIDYF